MTPATTPASTPSRPPSSGDILTEDQSSTDGQTTPVLGDSLAPDHSSADTHGGSVGGDLLDQGQNKVGDHLDDALVDTSTDSHGLCDFQWRPAVGVSAGDRRPSEVQCCPVPGLSVPPAATRNVATPEPGPSGGWDALRLFAEMYEDAQKARIGCENRVRSATVDEDLTAASLAALANAENELKKALGKQYKRTVPTPIQEWAKQTKGIGKTSPHLLARLLGVIGHPVLATPHHWEGEGTDRVLVADPPFLRNVAKLWAYCGHGDPSRKRAKGMSAAQAASLGNPRAKMIVHLLAEAVIKSANEDYRIVYDARREATAVIHPDWSKGHSHNDALHIVAKEILRDLWRAGSVDLGGRLAFPTNVAGRVRVTHLDTANAQALAEHTARAVQIMRDEIQRIEDEAADRMMYAEWLDGA